MDYPPLVGGTLLRRYKRFLADVRLDDGREVVAHCPNTGSMRAVNVPGARVWLSASDNPARKLAWTWELIELPDGDGGSGVSLASVHTGRANRIVEEALVEEKVVELRGYAQLKREAKIEDARLDFRLDDPARPRCYVEVKQVTLREDDGHGYFPDAVSERGRKHLETLARLASQGERAVLLFLVAHEGIDDVAPAQHLDPGYASTLQRVTGTGVEVLAYRICASRDELGRPLALSLDTSLPVRVDGRYPQSR
ncbi:MAG: DNA/RNA nuclease SfsA [Pseudomonadota bacterium]|nr:DNA/RNA nuclease SfsA [Pseudomonadota bacterium]